MPRWNGAGKGEREHMACDGGTLALGQAETLLRPCGGDVAVDERMHVAQPLPARKLAEIALEPVAVPIVAKEIVKQRRPCH